MLTGLILTPSGFVEGRLRVAEGRILAIDGEPRDEGRARAQPLPLLLPGFIDLHVHGGAGADVMDAGEAVHTLARLHAQHGTTALLATTMTAPLPEIEAALRALAPACSAQRPGQARVLGVHLEGPYIHPQRLGAQPPFARLPLLQEILHLHRLAPIRVLTLAPEVEGALPLIPALVQAGLRVQIGHSQASYEQAVAALQAGASGFTHLYNAMSALQHRAPGVVGAALAHARHAELIADGVHVHPGAMQVALRAVPGLFAVSDATAATGMPDGEYRLGRHTVTRCRDAVRLPDGTLAGSVLTLDQALRNLVQMGLSVAQASRCTSTHAADYLGEGELGRLTPGAQADVVALHPQTLAVQGVWVAGEAV
ncbi:MAG: N-acetylglucosamine-6-phosphate deacetylase [Rubrivivax sp.]|nr:N-acetylglucosamine-6-phosphate deacetylase [Rubrivivax sp.]